MPTASSNRTALRYMLEAVFGTTPVTGNPNNLRMTGESLAFAIQTDSSKEIRSDRQVTDLIQVGATASGGINFELSYAEFDNLLQAGFMSAWTVYGTNGVSAAMTFAINSTAGTLTASVATAGVDLFTTLAVGQFFRLTAPGDAADGAILRVLTTSSTVITVSTATPIPGTGTRATVVGCRVASSRISNGSTQRSYTLEKGMLDVGQFFSYRGMNVDKLSLSFSSGAIVTGTLDFMGKDSVRSNTTTLPGTPIASAAYDVVNAVTGVGNVLENGAALAGTFIKSLKLNLGNKLRAQDAIGVLGSAAVVPGTIEVTGEMEVYLADGTMYDKFINNTASSVVWSMKDNAGNGYAITLPKVKYSDAKAEPLTL